MRDIHNGIRSGAAFLTVVALSLSSLGCGPNYRELRWQGQQAVLSGAYGPARTLFQQADQHSPRHVENLHDLGACSVMVAREKFAEMKHAAAMREVDAAIAYYTRAIDAHPGHQASLEGKRIALKLKGQFDEALAHAKWAAEFIGPSAKQYVLLARELDDQGYADGALLRYRQAVAMEPADAEANIAFAKFLLRNSNEDAAVYHLQRAYLADPSDRWVVAELASRGAVPRLTAEEETAP